MRRGASTLQPASRHQATRRAAARGPARGERVAKVMRDLQPRTQQRPARARAVRARAPAGSASGRAVRRGGRSRGCWPGFERQSSASVAAASSSVGPRRPSGWSANRSESKRASENSRRSRSSTWPARLARASARLRGPNRCASIGSASSSPSRADGSGAVVERRRRRPRSTSARAGSPCAVGAGRARRLRCGRRGARRSAAVRPSASRPRSNRPSSALKTALQRPQRTQPSDTLS